MNLDRFLRERSPSWAELERAIVDARKKPERLGPDGARRLGSLYRSVAADLALARRRFAGDPVVGRLEELVGRARHLVYDSATRRRSVMDFFARDYWRLVASRPVPLIVAAVLLFGPWALSSYWALTDPGRASALVPPPYQSVTEPRPAGRDLGLSGAEQAAMSTRIFTNNIRVTFLAFAGGITAGLLTAAVTLYNGVFLGAVMGLATEAGNGSAFYQLVVAHGVLELSCIVVAAAAGLRMGWALIEPGRGRRVDALVREGRTAVEVVLGTAPWLVLAGLVEGFITPAGLGAAVVSIVGFGLGTLYWVLVIVRGRAATAAPSS